MATTTLSCPLCIDVPCADEFLLADHLMMAHLPWYMSSRDMVCFCGTVMSANIALYMAHLRHYGGAQEHYRAWQLGIDP